MKSFIFNDVKIDSLSFDEIKDRIHCNINNKGYVCLVEASGIVQSRYKPDLKKAINRALIAIPDGAPLAWFGKLIGSKNIERIPGVELMRKIFEERNNYCHFLLGDTEETITMVIERAKIDNPEIQIVGYSPPFKEKFSEEDNIEIFQRIKASNADLIWVSFGLEKQEKWMLENCDKISRGVMFGVGAAFKFYIDKIKMPHPFFQRIGMTWVSRLVEDPVDWLSTHFIYRIIFIFYFIREFKRKKCRGTK